MSGFIGTKLTMNLGERSYDIILKNGALENLYQFARLDRRVAVVTDAGVPAEYAQRVADQCRDAKIITVPQGEASKSMKILESVLRQMLEFNMGRGDLVIAVGGGVVGDLAGFAASIYMRGIDFINCPTTTLSMIDSSIGGKTAVDLGETKNIVGSFWQPKLVIVDPSTLATLPRRQYINGLAESVKASLLADPELFAIFEKGDIDEQIGEIIYRSLRFKKSIVEQDETEHGVRKALNFGHTIGHGIEAVKGVKGRRTVGLYHGECVALGMLPMIESKALQKRVRAVYRRLGLPLRTAYNKDKVYAEMLHDKKAQGGQITVIKVPGLGCWRAETIPVEGLRPLLGIPGKCGIAFISSFTGSDVAAVMTRDLYEEGSITDDERTIFVAYQYAGSACINNTITGGAPLVAISPVALGPCILIMVFCKIIGANIVRIILRLSGKKRSKEGKTA